MTTTTAPTPADLAAATPAQIDAQLSRIWDKQYATMDLIQYFRRQVDDYNKGLAAKASGDVHLRLQYSCYTETARDRCQASLDEERATLKALFAEAAVYEAEFERRGGWARYFKVLNGNGHIHTSRNCSTCYSTTRFGWIVELAGQGEDALVAKYGHLCCTICLPSAPVEELRRVYEATLYCPGSGKAPKSSYRAGRGRRGACPECGKNAALTVSGTLPKHKKAEK
jgi:hypothetical protein